MQPQLQAGGDAEVALAPADRPEEVGLALLARLHNLAVGGDHLGREQVVDRQPVLPDQEADSARERDPADPDRAGVAQARGTPPLAGGVGVLARRHPGLNPGGLRVGVDLEGAHAREVDHDPAFAGPVARAAVAAAADGQLEAALAGERDDASDVIRAGDPRHRGRSAVDALEEDLARLVVRGIVWADHLAVQVGAEIGGSRCPGTAAALTTRRLLSSSKDATLGNDDLRPENSSVGWRGSRRHQPFASRICLRVARFASTPRFTRRAPSGPSARAIPDSSTSAARCTTVVGPSVSNR